MDLLPTVEIEAESPPARSAVVWLHGLGADGHDFEPIVPHLGLTRTRFVFPNAPLMPVTMNGGWVMPSWYDILFLGRGANRENPDHVRVSAERITALIDREVARGIPAENIVLAGFSQGAAMAMHVGLRYPQHLAGIVALSGYLVLEDRLEAEQSDANRATPMFVAHGTRDETVPLDAGLHAWQRLKEGRDARWSSYPMAHEVSPTEIVALRRWFAEVLPA